MRRKRNTRYLRRKRQKAESNPFSIAFLIAIPGNFALACFGLISFTHLASQLPSNSLIWALFLSGLFTSATVVGTAKITRLRVLVHELKHAIMVIFTGNSLRNFVVKDATGHVEYELYRDKVHFAPIICLAPYFLPLFSFPVFIACLFLEGTNNSALAFALGVSLAADMSMAYTDLHPHQTDLQKVPGGTWFALMYLASAHFLWLMICGLWLLAGRKAFIYCGYIFYGMLRSWIHSL